MITKNMLSKTGTMPKKTTNLRKSMKNKLEGSKLKAGVSLDKVVKNVQQIFEEKKAETKVVKRRSGQRKRLNPKKLQRGIVYVGHIPHGFYEEQMKEYFKQFGSVTRVRVSRSKNTGKSRGYGYVEFVHAEVAKIAAETMNNYLMCGRLLKATYIPPEKQHQGFFGGRNWSEEMYPRLQERRKTIQMKNAVQSAEDYQRYVRKSCNKLSWLQEKLKAKGISMQFQPVDVPET